MPDLTMFPVDREGRRAGFPDRRTAGHLLGQALIHHAGKHALVLGLPRGGVPVADEVAKVLGGMLDVWVVRKLGAPSQPELGMGAIAEGPAVVLDRSIVRGLAVTSAEIFEIARHEIAELRLRVARFRGDRARPDPRGRTVILVDDGIATGGTAHAAIRAISKNHPARLVLATPVASRGVVESLAPEVDELVSLLQPEPLFAIGHWYEDFRQVSNEEVARILGRATTRPAA